MKARVTVLYWLDRRSKVDTWFGGPGQCGRPRNAIDIVTDQRPFCRGDVVEGDQVGHRHDSYDAATGKVLVVGIPVAQS